MTTAPEQKEPENSVVGAAAALIVLLIALLATTSASATEARRLAGDNRITTAVAASADQWPMGSAAHAVLVRSDSFADALAATPLAAGSGPILLTGRDELDGATEAELRRVVPAGGTVYLTGGPAAIGDPVAAEVGSLGFNVVRLAGENRFGTAVAIADEVVRLRPAAEGLVVLADGGTFQAALPAGVAAANMGGVLLLTSGPDLPPQISAYLDARPGRRLIAVGPDAAAATEGRVRDAIVGGDVYETAVLLADASVPGGLDAGLASGEDFPDALSGGAHSATLRKPLLLSPRTTLPPVVINHLSVRPDGIVHLYGGTAALAAAVEEQVAGGGGPPVGPPGDVGPPTVLQAPSIAGQGHILAATPTRTYWEEYTNGGASCIEGGRARLVIQDGSGRRTTGILSDTFPGLGMTVSPDGRHAALDGFCDDGYFLKGYADVEASSGELTNFVRVGSQSFDESPLRFRSDGLIVAVVDVDDNFAAREQVRLINPDSGQEAILYDFGNDYGDVLYASPSLTLVREFRGIDPFMLVLDGAGGFIREYSLGDGRTMVSPDGRWLLSSGPGSAALLLVDDLVAGTIEVVADYSFAQGDGFADFDFSQSGQVAVLVRDRAEYDLHLWDPDTDVAATRSFALNTAACEFAYLSLWGAGEGELFLGYDSGCEPTAHQTLSVRIDR